MDEEAFGAFVEEHAAGADFIVVDTPGRDDPLARYAATQADTLVTPLNDSFVDFDLLAQIEAADSALARSQAVVHLPVFLVTATKGAS